MEKLEIANNHSVATQICDSNWQFGQLSGFAYEYTLLYTVCFLLSSP